MPPIILLALGVGVFIIATKKASSAPKAKSTASATTTQAGGIAQQAVGSLLAMVGIQGPGSAKGNGNANQPWYTGPVVAGASAAASGIGKGLASLATQSNPTNTADEPDVDDSDLESSQSEMATSSASATSDDEELADNESSDDSSSGDDGSEDA